MPNHLDLTIFGAFIVDFAGGRNYVRFFFRDFEFALILTCARSAGRIVRT